MPRVDGEPRRLRRAILWSTGAVLGFAAVFGGCFTVVSLASRIDFGLDFDLDLSAPGATPEELAAAATTVPPTRAECGALDRLVGTSKAVAHANFDSDLGERDFEAYRARLTLLLTAFDRHLRAASTAAQGPMRTHIDAARKEVAEGLADLTTARSARQYDSLSNAADGYLELAVADDLLGDTCSGTLVPPFEDALDWLTPTTTAPAD